jgi:hypothetical protein
MQIGEQKRVGIAEPLRVLVPKKIEVPVKEPAKEPAKVGK